jgi:hypothetical protein
MYLCALSMCLKHDGSTHEAPGSFAQHEHKEVSSALPLTPKVASVFDVQTTVSNREITIDPDTES